LVFNYFGPRLIVQLKGGIFNKVIDRKNLPTPESFDLEADTLVYKSKEGLYLRGYLIYSNIIPQKGTVIFVHGIRAYKEHFLPVCKLLAERGYNSVIVDLRAHGESEGKYCTYGFYEKYDIKALADKLYKIKNISRNIGIWGQSLGGAVAIQALALDKRIKFGIIESTFSEFNTIVHDYIKNKVGFDIPVFSNYLIWRATHIGNFKADSIIPSQSAKKITQPILMAHGVMDDRIKIEYGKSNFANLSSKEKEFIEIPKANHLNLWQIGGKVYFDKVFAFIDKQVEKE